MSRSCSTWSPCGPAWSGAGSVATISVSETALGVTLSPLMISSVVSPSEPLAAYADLAQGEDRIVVAEAATTSSTTGWRNVST